MWFVPQAGPLQINGPFRITEIATGLDEGLPVIAGPRGRRNARERRDWVSRLHHMVEDTLGGCGPDAGQKMQQTEAGDPVPRVLDEPQQGQHVLDVGGVEELQSAEFHEWDVPARQFDFERTAVARCAEQNGLFFEDRAGLAVLQYAFDDEARLVGLVAHGDELRLRGRSPFGPEVLGEAFLRKSDDVEGVVSKVRDSRYNSGRGNDWVKKTCAQRETLSIAGFAMKENKFDGLTWLASREGSWSMPARSTTVSTALRQRTCRAVSSRWSGRPSPMLRELRIAASGWSRRCWRKSNTGRSPRREKFVIRFSKEFARTSDGQGCV
jgi:hypothetical protein